MFEYKGNQFAKLCCDLVANKKAPFTALYLYGPDGCGKSALCEYIENTRFIANKDDVVVKYSAGYLSRLDWDERSAAFDEAKRSDICIIEDLDRCDISEQFLTDLTTLVNTMNLKGKKIVITGDKPLDKSSGFLKSNFLDRMKWEMIVRVDMPTHDDCLNALRQFSNEDSYCKKTELEKIYEMVINAEGCNLGHVLSTFRRIVVRSQMNNKKLTLKQAENVIYDCEEIELIGA